MTHTVVFSPGKDEDCVAMALLGFSTIAIASKTGLTQSQVGYRVRKASVKRWDTRHGKSEMANQIWKLVAGRAKAQVKSDIAPKFLPLGPGRINQ